MQRKTADYRSHGESSSFATNRQSFESTCSAWLQASERSYGEESAITFNPSKIIGDGFHDLKRSHVLHCRPQIKFPTIHPFSIREPSPPA